MDGKCSATNKDGSPCSGPALPGRAFCWSHDPQLEERRRAGRVRGGTNRANAARAKKAAADVMTLTELRGRLCVVFDEVASGELDKGVGVALASIAKAIASIAQVSDLEERLAALEAAAGLERRRAWW